MFDVNTNPETVEFYKQHLDQVATSIGLEQGVVTMPSLCAAYLRLHSLKLYNQRIDMWLEEREKARVHFEEEFKQMKGYVSYEQLSKMTIKELAEAIEQYADD